MAKPIQQLQIVAYNETAFISAMKRLRHQGYEIKLAVYIHNSANKDNPLRAINPPSVTISLNKNDPCPVCKSRACLCSQPKML